MLEFWCVSRVEIDRDSLIYFVHTGDLEDPAAHVIAIDTAKARWEVMDGDEVLQFVHRQRLNGYGEPPKYMIVVKPVRIGTWGLPSCSPCRVVNR